MIDIIKAIDECLPHNIAWYNKETVVSLFMELYEDIKHGDEEHQKWLLDKINEFITKIK